MPLLLLSSKLDPLHTYSIPFELSKSNFFTGTSFSRAKIPPLSECNTSIFSIKRLSGVTGWKMPFLYTQRPHQSFLLKDDLRCYNYKLKGNVTQQRIILWFPFVFHTISRPSIHSSVSTYNYKTRVPVLTHSIELKDFL